MFDAATELSRGESNGNPWAKCRVRDPFYVCIPHNNPRSMPPQHPNPTLFPAIHKLVCRSPEEVTTTAPSACARGFYWHL